MPRPRTHRAVRAVPAVTSGSLRLLRGLVVGASATTLAAVGHALAGGPVPSALPLAAVLATASAVGTVLAGRRWTLAPLLLVLAGVQVAFHVGFSGSPYAGPAGSTHAGHALAHPAMSGHGGWSMVAGHALAALLTAVLLRRGEDACWRLADLVGRAWRIAVAEQHPSLPSPAAHRTSYGVLLPATELLRYVASRRGPPSFAAA